MTSSDYRVANAAARYRGPAVHRQHVSACHRRLRSPSQGRRASGSGGPPARRGGQL